MPDVADVTKESCVLTWEAPEKDGGTPVIGYHMERCTGTLHWWELSMDPADEGPHPGYNIRC